MDSWCECTCLYFRREREIFRDLSIGKGKGGFVCMYIGVSFRTARTGGVSGGRIRIRSHLGEEGHWNVMYLYWWLAFARLHEVGIEVLDTLGGFLRSWHG